MKRAFTKKGTFTGKGKKNVSTIDLTDIDSNFNFIFTLRYILVLVFTAFEFLLKQQK